MTDHEKRGIVGIPLWARDGSVRAWAIVDADSADDLAVLRWHVTPYGYACSRFSASEYLYMHRVVLDLGYGDPLQADHINGDRLDNRRSNLRVATAAENRQNQRRAYRGASLLPSGRWRAQGCVSGQSTHIGVFDTREEAARAASAFRAEHLPFSVEVAA